MPGIQRAAHEVASDDGRLFLVGLEGSKLRFFFPVDGVLREHRVAQHVGEQFQSGGEVGLHDFHGNAEGIVPRFRTDAAADGLDLVGNFLVRPRGCALEEHARKEAVDAVGFSGFSEDSGLETGDHGDERKPWVFADEQS